MLNMPGILILDLGYLKQLFTDQMKPESTLTHYFTMNEAVEIAIEFKDNIGDFFDSNDDYDVAEHNYLDQSDSVWMMAEFLSRQIGSTVGHPSAWYFYSFLEWLSDDTIVLHNNQIELPTNIHRRVYDLT